MSSRQHRNALALRIGDIVAKWMVSLPAERFSNEGLRLSGPDLSVLVYQVATELIPEETRSNGVFLDCSTGVPERGTNGRGDV